MLYKTETRAHRAPEFRSFFGLFVTLKLINLVSMGRRMELKRVVLISGWLLCLGGR